MTDKTDDSWISNTDWQSVCLFLRSRKKHVSQQLISKQQAAVETSGEVGLISKQHCEFKLMRATLRGK